MRCAVQVGIELTPEEKEILRFVKEAPVEKVERLLNELSKINEITEFKQSFEDYLNKRKQLEFAIA